MTLYSNYQFLLEDIATTSTGWPLSQCLFSGTVKIHWLPATMIAKIWDITKDVVSKKVSKSSNVVI